MTLTINQPIPAISFQVYWQNRVQPLKLETFKGKWLVLLFYPADTTSTCTTELKEAAMKYGEIQKHNAELISISVDSAESHQTWHQSSPAIHAITFPMASDPEGTIAKSFGVFNQDTQTAWRATFIINPEGLLKAYEVHDNAIGRSVTEIIRKLTLFQFVAKRITK